MEFPPDASGGDIDFRDHDAVVSRYYPQVVALIQRVTGATAVFPFDHNVRTTSPGGSMKNSAVRAQPPLGVNYNVHGDYTVMGAPRRLLDLTRAAKLIPAWYLDDMDASRVQPRRYCILNVWRPFGAQPVQRMPLAVCASQGVAMAEQLRNLVVFEIHYEDRVGENFFAKFHSEHQWHFYPHMHRGECLLFKQWDSWGGLATAGLGVAEALAQRMGTEPEGLRDAVEVLGTARKFDAARRTQGMHSEAVIGGPGASTFVLHTAVEDPQTPADAPDRESIEVRSIAFF
eukprot:NODE_13246_length_1176_cov_7.645377.p1 GENE.NODE_13246_length_1176_cov_7.645377~~NODE_13246_length_1176_cov_7.645377.p1  ORF type:complete len:334 (-),score=66.47 NODE_13246_length_1176_cov_7.645377:174-1034(-)